MSSIQKLVEFLARRTGHKEIHKRRSASSRCPKPVCHPTVMHSQADDSINCRPDSSPQLRFDVPLNHAGLANYMLSFVKDEPSQAPRRAFLTRPAKWCSYESAVGDVPHSSPPSPPVSKSGGLRSRSCSLLSSSTAPWTCYTCRVNCSFYQGVTLGTRSRSVATDTATTSGKTEASHCHGMETRPTARLNGPQAGRNARGCMDAPSNVISGGTLRNK